jgi:hypothetical protein
MRRSNGRGLETGALRTAPALDPTGIAAKATPKGRITLGGSKEVAYAVYAALNDPTSPGYATVRQ